jgi:hypothetical protein
MNWDAIGVVAELAGALAGRAYTAHPVTRIMFYPAYD